MAEYRVVGVDRETRTGNPRDPHVHLLCLEDGRRIPVLRAISNLKYGVETYYTEVAGSRAKVRAVGPCSNCGDDYLRADDERSLKDTLLALPGCGQSATL
jgi:hypothetical protein